MTPEEVEVGMHVIYKPWPKGQPEDGYVERIHDGGMVMVRYTNGPQAGKVCGTKASDLTFAGRFVAGEGDQP